MPPAAEEEFNVLAAGDIHEGKSQLVDNMRDKSLPDSFGPGILQRGRDSNHDGTTKGCTPYMGKVLEGRRLKIFDSPGISDGSAFRARVADETDDEAEPDDAGRENLAAGTGGLLRLLASKFEQNQINLLLIVHPCDKDAVQMGTKVLRGLIDKGLIAGDKDAWKNVVVVFTKADKLGTGKEKKVAKKNLINTILPSYFEGIRPADAEGEPAHCFTTGIPVRTHARSSAYSPRAPHSTRARDSGPTTRTRTRARTRTRTRTRSLRRGRRSSPSTGPSSRRKSPASSVSGPTSTSPAAP